MFIDILICIDYENPSHNVKFMPTCPPYWMVTWYLSPRQVRYDFSGEKSGRVSEDLDGDSD